MMNSLTRFNRIVLGIGAILLLMPLARLNAQYENGSILGTIRDASSSPISNADVSIVSKATAISNQAKTDGNGNYEVPQLRVGIYKVTASADGFSSAVADDIPVSVGNLQRIDLRLKVGTTETTVEVSDVPGLRQPDHFCSSRFGNPVQHRDE